MIQIKPLKECLRYAPILAYWTYKEWYKHRDVKFDLLIAAYRNRVYDEKLPYTWVAIEGGFPAGMVSLKQKDLAARPDLDPWLSSLYVDPDYRRRGIGGMLADRAVSRAGELGFKRLYLFLGISNQAYLDKYYRERGWSFLGASLDNDGKNTRIFYLDTKTENYSAGLNNMNMSTTSSP